jgi:DNA (cytosine-5)-methyltransferase 1
MGYKLAGFTMLGGVDIDPDMMTLYRENHKPKHSYLMGVQEFNQIANDQLPRELFELDVLDGSPPCSVFSMAGDREKAWGIEKKFREGQMDQRLDDLFFHFIDVAAKLRPKMVVAENVKGLILGNAKGYVKEIFAAFRKAGYSTQLFLLTASRMGVPQRRERTFFIARRTDLNLPPISYEFNEPEIPVIKAFTPGFRAIGHKSYKDEIHKEWQNTTPGKNFSDANPKGHHFNYIKLDPLRPSCTIASSSSHIIFRWDEFRSLNEGELIRVQSFPDDYNFMTEKPGYVTGMSVPPFMMQRVATGIADLLLGNGHGG